MRGKGRADQIDILTAFRIACDEITRGPILTVTPSR